MPAISFLNRHRRSLIRLIIHVATPKGARAVFVNTHGILVGDIVLFILYVDLAQAAKIDEKYAGVAGDEGDLKRVEVSREVCSYCHCALNFVDVDFGVYANNYHQWNKEDALEKVAEYFYKVYAVVHILKPTDFINVLNKIFRR